MYLLVGHSDQVRTNCHVAGDGKVRAPNHLCSVALNVLGLEVERYAKKDVSTTPVNLG